MKPTEIREKNLNETRNDEDHDSEFTRRKEDSIRGFEELKPRIAQITNRLSRDSDNSSTLWKNNQNEITENSEQTDKDLKDFAISKDLFSQLSENEQRSNVDSVESSTNDPDEIISERMEKINKSKWKRTSTSKCYQNNLNERDDRTDDQCDELTREKSPDTLVIDIKHIPLLHSKTLEAPPEEIKKLPAEGVTVKQGMWSVDEVSILKSNWDKLNKTSKGKICRKYCLKKKRKTYG